MDSKFTVPRFIPIAVALRFSFNLQIWMQQKQLGESHSTELVLYILVVLFMSFPCSDCVMCGCMQLRLTPTIKDSPH